MLFCSDIGVGVVLFCCGWESHAFIYNATGIQCLEYHNLIDSQASVACGEVPTPTRCDGNVKNLDGRNLWHVLAIYVALKPGELWLFAWLELFPLRCLLYYLGAVQIKVYTRNHTYTHQQISTDVQRQSAIKRSAKGVGSCWKQDSPAEWNRMD